MTLSLWTCAHCGHWQRWFAPPPSCPVCSDVRNALPEDGWDLRAEPDVAAAHRTVWRRVLPGVTEFSTRPVLGLGSVGWLIETGLGNVCWEATGHYGPEALGRIERLGGVAVLGSSHVHGYGALWQLQDHFAPPDVVVGTEDLTWTKTFRVTRPVDERMEIAPGLTVHRTGGHFAGHCVLHDAGRGVLFCGDALKPELDASGRAVGLSCHKAFHARIPLSRAELSRYREILAPLAFTAIATPFEYAAPVTTADVLHLIDRLLEGRAHTDALPLGSRS
ncbi:MBL fold metallo-hydrolase [Streptomyces sp. NPDC058459]|uniref:MBL fold metallo-hydrolase n=1 Tax=Streptomyces sp. NPDC058459 TaxID=3346508 RepID=UPI0036510D4F